MSGPIDRQAAIDTLADMYCKSDEDGYVWIIRSDAWARLDALPSAQPERTGKWIRISPAKIYECSICGKNVMTADIDEYHFCHWCGARMEETT